MSASYPTYQDEQEIMYMEEDRDRNTQHCVVCNEELTEDNWAGESGQDGECDDCAAQRWEMESLESEAGRIASELAEALDDYHKSRVKAKETLKERLTVETLREALSMIKGALE